MQLNPQKGMALPDVLVTLLLSSIVLLSTSQILVMLRAGNIKAQRWQQIQESIAQLLDRIDKDLTRSGFCAQGCSVPQPMIASTGGESANSCLIVFYDLDTNGRIDLSCGYCRFIRLPLTQRRFGNGERHPAMFGKWLGQNHG